MKKIIYFLFLILFTTSKAQTIAETVDWLNTKKSEITSTESYTIEKGTSSNITFTKQHIKIEGNYKSTSFKWATIVDFRVNENVDKPSLYLISDEMEKGLPLYIILKFETEDTRDRFIKAIKNITRTNGNELVNPYSENLAENIQWLNAKAIDVFEGSVKQRVNYSNSGIKIYNLNNSESYTINWGNIKSLSYKLYDKNKKYYIITLKSSDASSGSAKEKKIYVSKFVGETYGRILKNLALKKGAKFIDEDLF
ncbi:hypothetical protein [Halpernia sp.]|uniref:hypothetical protein n=1 Tax=Halpernia sp. TaxID=2782209 RepID=UPI003A8E5548